MEEPLDESKANPTAPYEQALVKRAVGLLDELPKSIGPYRILERIGQGGMGEVLRAEQRQPIRREVALKVIKLGMDTKLVLARFEAERQALALMDHPHIAKVLEAGADDTGRPYFVMEYVRGRPITEYSDANHLSIPERLQLFSQVCHAIQHAHHKGIIHRDIKPSNVLVSTQDGEPFAKVIDFGIAKATNQQLTDRTLFTLHNQFIGTPQYMSPEQAEGSADFDTRTDVYSLGVMLYELLTGVTPFSTAELREAAFEKVKEMIRAADPAKPSTRLSQSGAALPALAAARRTEPAKLGTLVRGELDWIVMRALEKDRRRRYDTPSSLADDVQRHLRGEQVEAAPPSRSYRLAKSAYRYRWPLVGVATVIAILATSTAIISTLAVRLSTAAADAAVKQAEAETQRDAALSQRYINSLALVQQDIRDNSFPSARAHLEELPPASRGWEWFLLTNMSSTPRAGCPFAAYKNVFITPDGAYLLASTIDNSYLLDLKASTTVAEYGNIPHRRTSHRSFPQAVMSRNASVVVNRERYIDIYNRRTLVSRIDKPNLGIELLPQSFSGDEHTLLAYSTDDRSDTQQGEILVFDVANGAPRAAFEVPQLQLDSLQVAPNGTFYAICDQSKLRAYGRDGECLHTFAVSTDAECWAYRLAVSADSGYLAVGTTSGNVHILGTTTWDVVANLSFKPDYLVESLVFSHDSRYVAASAAHSDGRSATSVWELGSGSICCSVDKSALHLAFTPHDQEVCGFEDGSFLLWNRSEPKWRWPARDAKLEVYAADSFVAVSRDYPRPRVWDTREQSVRPVLRSNLGKPVGVSLLPDDNTTLTPMRIRIGALEVPLESVDHHLAPAIALTSLNLAEGSSKATPNQGNGTQPWLLTATTTDGACLLNTETGAVLQFTRNQLTSCELPRFARLLLGGADGSVTVVDTDRWEVLTRFKVSKSAISDIMCSEEGNEVLITTANGGLAYWDLRSATRRAAFESHLEAAWADSDLVNSRGKYSIMQAWDDICSPSHRPNTPESYAASAVLLSNAIKRRKEALEASFRTFRERLVFKRDVSEALDRVSRDSWETRYIANLLKEWEESLADREHAYMRIAADASSPRKLVQRALAKSREDARLFPLNNSLRLRIGELEHCLGNHSFARQLLTEGNAWTSDEGLVDDWAAMTRVCCFLAEAEERLGNHREALKRLRTALRYWIQGSEQTSPYSALQRRAAEAVYANALDELGWRPNQQYENSPASSVPALSEQRPRLGSSVAVKGCVVRICPSRSGKRVHLLLDNQESGVIAFAKTTGTDGVNLTRLLQFDGRLVQLHGKVATLDDFSGSAAWTSQRVVVEITDSSKIELLGDQNDSNLWWVGDAKASSAE